MPNLNTPLLLLVFHRPEETARVFAAIRAQQPRQLFIAGDGPRTTHATDVELVRLTRDIVTKVDWPCEVQTLFHESNLGCGKAVSRAISWFFSQVEAGIILEDDCLPHADFFPYCETLLARYRDDPRVATIGGTHCLPASLSHEQTHYASKYFQMWGWASWRRVWQHYDFKLENLAEDEWVALLARTHPITVEASYWHQIYQALKGGLIDTWDFQMFFTCWRIGGQHIMPSKNLVSNIGHGPNATHTNFASPMACLPTHALSIDAREIDLTPNSEVDNLVFYLRFLESMTQTWWIDQVLCTEQKLGQTRLEVVKKDRKIQQLEQEVIAKRKQLLDATRALTAQLP